MTESEAIHAIEQSIRNRIPIPYRSEALGVLLNATKAHSEFKNAIRRSAQYSTVYGQDIIKYSELNAVVSECDKLLHN